MDDLDRSILNRIQSDFPITGRPWDRVAQELEVSEAEVIGRVRALKESGIIRRIGGNFSPASLGFVSTLCAARVPGDGVEAFAREVNRFSGVTHNYKRDDDYNVWFTFIAPSMEEIREHLAEIRERTGIRDILNLPATRVFKIRAQFSL